MSMAYKRNGVIMAILTIIMAANNGNNGVMKIIANGMAIIIIM
jgi:hypothetical protein